jgi:hypothetical protein
MTRPVPWLRILVLALAVAGCDRETRSKSRASDGFGPLTVDQRDAAVLGREIYDLVDRAVAYRGSHQGRPANSLRQMGVESLTPATVRRVVNVERQPVVTVAFRKTAGREIHSCRGDSQILEDITLNGRFTIMCTASSGAQRPMEVGAVLDP